MALSVDYSGYEAKALASGRPGLHERLKSSARWLRTRLVPDIVLYPYGIWRHRQLRHNAVRSASHTYTCFLRSPAQLDALAGPVLRMLAADSGKHRLSIHVHACSNGAEAYTLASWLSSRAPMLDFRITATDLHQEMVDKAACATYTAAEVLHSEHMTQAFLDATFDRVDERYVVKAHLRERVSFARADLLGDDLERRFGRADIVSAQNVLFHLAPADARRAFDNLCRQLAPGAVLMVEGMDHDLRVELTQRHALTPLPFNARAIYAQARRHVPAAWWNYYYGGEPYSLLRRDRHRRFGSLFVAPR